MGRGRRAAAALGAAAVAAVALALAGCGGAGDGGGGAAPGAPDGATARLWVTTERGANVLVDTRVEPGQSLLRALRRHADVDTRYGGRFVQAIDGLEGDAGRRRDWFWFVNGMTGDRSAAEYRLRAGDVAWWDYRDWTADPELAVVAGAFPEPFVHGFDGRTRPVAVRFEPGLRAAARRIAARLRATDVAPAGRAVASGAHVFELRRGAPALRAVLREPGTGPTGAVRFSFSGDVDALLSGAYERRFEVP